MANFYFTIKIILAALLEADVIIISFIYYYYIIEFTVIFL